MSKKLSPFLPVRGFDGLWSARSATLRCTAIRLKSGELCLYSPVAGLSVEVLESLKAIGDVQLLLAPNQYHNMGLKEYHATFPDAKLCCSGKAKPRLEKITGLKFDTLESLDEDLPDTMQILEPDGLKTGEIWIRIQGQDQLAWILTDAFCGPKGKQSDMSDKPELLGTFPKFGVADKKIYSHWVDQTLSRNIPTRIIPCHGSMISGPNLGKALRTILTSL